MPLFQYLNDDAFLIFSRKHRYLFEAALMEIYDQFFAGGAVFPSPLEVVNVIYDLIARRPDFIFDADGLAEGLPELVSKGRRKVRFAGMGGESGNRALKTAQAVYQALLRTGWLEQEEFGLKVTVDMPMGALLVVQRFASLQSDVSQRFGGLVIHIKTSLEQVEKLANSNTERDRSSASYALREARLQAEAFVKTLRAILSDLKRIRRALTEADDLRQKMDTYFEEFIGELLLKDFQSILTFNHPYRFRDQIVSTARRICFTEELVTIIGAGYLEIGLAQDAARAREAAQGDLLSIEQTFETVGDMFDRISAFRRGLETRLRNTVRYAEHGERGLASRARELVARLEALLAADPDRYIDPTVPGLIERVSSPWSERQLAPQRRARQPVMPTALAMRAQDPLHAFRKQLRTEYLRRISPSPELVRAFLGRIVRPNQTVEARFIELGSVDDFLAFDAVRRYALTREAPGLIASDFEFVFLPDSEPHDCEWLRCSNFSIHHRGTQSARKA